MTTTPVDAAPTDPATLDADLRHHDAPRGDDAAVLTTGEAMDPAPAELVAVRAPRPVPSLLGRTRHLPLRTVFNVRDLGGYRTVDGRVTRWRRVLRADGLHNADDGDVTALATLGLRTVVDLRTPGEVDERGQAPAERFGARYLHLPVLREIWSADQLEGTDDVVAFLTARYVEMLDEGTPALTAALELIASDAHLPLVFHCSAGKDRTGVLAALVLELVGVDRGVIAHDYGLSRSGVTAMRAWVRANHPEALDAMNDQPAAFFACPPAAMRAFLAHLEREHGGARGWARAAGVGDDVLDELSHRLLEPT
ncbi:MAG TPA: tyrosine-protein phosphatase [Acidimicrobiales bacterium]|nr:tyrosine-protein phosphatase [Acidimicrobiales bacterium]